MPRKQKGSVMVRSKKIFGAARGLGHGGTCLDGSYKMMTKGK